VLLVLVLLMLLLLLLDRLGEHIKGIVVACRRRRELAGGLAKPVRDRLRIAAASS
jgi:hypothetical protein